MCRNPVNFLYNPGHVTLLCVEVGPVANGTEGSTQEHNCARVEVPHGRVNRVRVNRVTQS